MANKKLAPNRGKRSAAKEAEESALQLARSPLPGTGRRALSFASDDAESTPPAPAKSTASASAKNKAHSLDKNKASASAKNKAPVPDKNEAPASAKNKAPVPDKNKASASAKNAVAVPAAPDEDEVAAAPQDTTLRRFINFLCEKAASIPWRGLLDAFLTWVHSRSSAGDEAQAAAPTEGSTHQEQREKNTQHQASPQLPEEHTGRRKRHVQEHRCQNYAFKYGKDTRRRKSHDRDKIEEDCSVPTDLSISQQERDFDDAEADRIIPAGPSISKIVEDYEKFDPYLSSDIHKEYIKIMSSCPPGMEVCTFCYFEKDVKTRRSQSHRIPHISTCHDSFAGVKCTNCPARFPSEHVRDLHRMHCNA